ncbi:MAG: carbon-nitrogen hydrolase family protein [Bryobacterales bacterium]|nr:carbon-nitrogen hydrolase family protein [Bryobacteraceae bacterium]MDW8129247.1 carbon-nitrogen hydrolase family protein [Bryobacterales bacterium]
MAIEFLLGMGQMLVEGGQPEANLRRALAMIREAARRGCRAVVLPECLDLGWTHPAARTLAQPIPGPYSDLICEAAREAGIYVVAGLAERCDDRLYNAAVLVSPQGTVLLKHRKINELAIAHDLYATGDRLGVADTSLGVVAVNICADNFPESLALAHAQARMGARILLSPCAWAVEADHDQQRQPYGDLWLRSYTTLARLYDMTVVGVSNVGWLREGPWRGRRCIGCSLAVGPGGRILARGPYGETAEAMLVVPVRVEPLPARGTALLDLLRERGYEGP